MRQDVEAALRFLFGERAGQARTALEPLDSDRVKWAVLALSEGDESQLADLVRAALDDYRDVLLGAEYHGPELTGPIIRALPRAEELAFKLHAVLRTMSGTILPVSMDSVRVS